MLATIAPFAAVPSASTARRYRRADAVARAPLALAPARGPRPRLRRGCRPVERRSPSPPPPASSSPSSYGGPNMFADSQAIAPPSPRRVFLGVLATGGLALGGNFLGVTGKLLNGAPEVAESLRLDIIYPVNGFKRCYNPEKGYEFVYPRLPRRRHDGGARREPARGDEPSGSSPRRRRAQASQDFRSDGPGAAIRLRTHGRHRRGERLRHRQPLAARGFRLDRFGDAKNQAEWLLANVLARAGSGKTSELYDSYTSASRRAGPSTTRSSTPYGQRVGTGTTSPCSPSTADGCTRWWRRFRRWGGGRGGSSFGVWRTRSESSCPPGDAAGGDVDVVFASARASRSTVIIIHHHHLESATVAATSAAKSVACTSIPSPTLTRTNAPSARPSSPSTTSRPSWNRPSTNFWFDRHVSS